MIGQKLKEMRLSKHLTLEELATSLNRKYPETVNFNKGKLSKWENNREEPKLSSIRILADFYGLTIDELYSEKQENSDIIKIYSKLNNRNKQLTLSFAKIKLSEQSSSKLIKITNGRSTAAGSPLDGAFQDSQTDTMVIDSIEIPNGADEMVTIAGDSMEPLLKKGQQVFIHYQPTIENGEIALLAIQDEGVTCKKVYFNDSNFTIVLESLNDKYEDMVYPFDAIRIIGKVIL